MRLRDRVKEMRKRAEQMTDPGSRQADLEWIERIEATLNPPVPDDHVRVRLAVAVDEEGRIGVHPIHEFDIDAESMTEALRNVSSDGPIAQAYVEVDLPLIVTVRGRDVEEKP